MKKTRSILTLFAITAAMAMSAQAAADGQLEGQNTAAAGTDGSPAQVMPDNARMNDQMKLMREMHEKMVATKTPEERDALMDEHRTTMQDGMAMMNRMERGEMSGMQDDLATRQKMMEQRMDMMQSMMQMTMDRMAPAPAAK